MSTKKIKKKIFIYCEGASERNYFQALKGNKHISQNYTLEINSNENDLYNAIKRFERLKHDSAAVFVYDSDTYKQGEKEINEKHKKYKENIYFSDENFEDFLACHKTKPYYRDKKPNLSRQMINEIRKLDYDYIKNELKKPSRFKDFKTIYTLLIELFEKKL